MLLPSCLTYLPLFVTYPCLSSFYLPLLPPLLLAGTGPRGTPIILFLLLLTPLPNMAVTPPLNLASYNCRGFNTPEKRSQILYHFHKQKGASILLLQETHFRSGSTPTIRNRYYTTWFHSTNPLAKSKGVSIAFHRSFHPEVLDSCTDVNGHFVFSQIKT